MKYIDRQLNIYTYKSAYVKGAQKNFVSSHI